VFSLSSTRNAREKAKKTERQFPKAGKGGRRKLNSKGLISIQNTQTREKEVAKRKRGGEYRRAEVHVKG